MLNITTKRIMPAKKISVSRATKSSIASQRVEIQSGVSLIELMVALVIGLVVSLAVYGVLTTSEARKRTTTSANDIDQAGAYALYKLDKAIRSSGSGFSAGGIPLDSVTRLENSAYSYSCPLRLARNGAQLIPAANFPVPFNGVNGNLVMAPVIIVDNGAGAGGDILITMAGSGGLGESGTKLTSTPAGGSLDLATQAGMSASVNILGVNTSDKLLLVAPPLAGAMAPCLVSEIAAGFVPTVGAATVPLGGAYYSAGVAGTTLANFTPNINPPSPIGSMVLNLGKNPAFNMMGVGANNTLFSYDLLSAPNLNGVTPNISPNPSIFVDSVYRMEAVYGVNQVGNPALVNLAWVAPVGNFSAATLMSGTAAANADLRRIVAIRVALIMTTALPERANVSAANTIIFNSIGLPQVIPLAPLNRRYRIMESTISMRNLVL